MINDIKKIIKKNSNFRFPPDPNGYLHIGHIFNIMLNYFLSKKNNGFFILRFDNTNLSNCKIKFYNFIIFDLLWLGIKWNKIKYSLNYIKNNKKILFYYLKIKKNYLKKYNYFLRFFFNFLKYSIIIELIISNFYCKKNFCFFIKKKIIYRKKNKKNHNSFFPTYDFSQCFDDYFNNIFVSICTKEFELNSKIYNFLMKQIYFKPIQIEFEKKKIKSIKISKRNLKKIFFLNIFYFRKIKINSKNFFFLCNTIGISKNNSIIKNIFFSNSFKLDNNFYPLIFLFFEINFLKNFKKNIFFSIFNNKKNINLNLNFFYFNKYLKNNLLFLNFLNFNSFFIFKKKVFFLKYKILKYYSFIIKKTFFLKIKSYNIKKRHCLYDNKLINKNILLIK